MTEQFAGLLWQRFKDMYGQKWTAMFQGPEAIESWRITWSQLNVSAGQIKHALSRIGTEFPEWPPTFGQFKALCGCFQPLALPAPKYEPKEPPKRVMDALKAAVKSKPAGPWWTPDKVVNASQIAVIVRQAHRNGPESQAGRFLQQCLDAGVITSDYRLPVKEPEIA